MIRWIRNRGAVAILLSAASLTAAVITADPLISLLTYSLLGILMVAFVIAFTGSIGLQIERKIDATRAQIGGVIEEKLTLRQAVALPRWGVELRDHSTLPGHAVSRPLPGSVAVRRHEIAITTRCVKRGQFTLGPLTAISVDPFGLFSFQKEFPQTTNLLILPAFFPLAGLPTPIGILPGGDALHQRSQQVTANAVSIREYQTGDSFNRIHWPSTARKNRVISREFELDPLADIYLIPDLDRSQQVEWTPMKSEESINTAILPTTEEYVITTAASLADHFTSSGRSVGMICYPRQREEISADRGERQRLRLLETLAILRADSPVSLNDALYFERETMPRGALMIVITPSTREDWLVELNHFRSRGVSVMALLVEPLSFGGRPGTDALEEMLTHLKLPHQIIRRSETLPSFFQPESR